MIVCIQSLVLNPRRCCRCRSAERISSRSILCSTYKLALNHRSSGSQAVSANALTRFTPHNLSTSLLARPSDAARSPPKSP
jgi:hypothetical protein